MQHDYRIAIIVLIVGAAVTYGVFSTPSLMTTSAPSQSNVSQEEFNATVSRELAYCQGNTENINCRCFANKSGAILTETRPRIRNAVYADQTELARGQAANSC